MRRRCLLGLAATTSIFARTIVAALSIGLLAGCSITSRVEPYKRTTAVIGEGEQVVILARKHHATHEAEAAFVDCVSAALAGGSDGLDVHDTVTFEDQLYPWFEPSRAPLSTDELSELLDKPDVFDQVRSTAVAQMTATRASVAARICTTAAPRSHACGNARHHETVVRLQLIG